MLHRPASIAFPARMRYSTHNARMRSVRLRLGASQTMVMEKDADGKDVSTIIFVRCDTPEIRDTLLEERGASLLLQRLRCVVQHGRALGSSRGTGQDAACAPVWLSSAERFGPPSVCMAEAGLTRASMAQAQELLERQPESASSRSRSWSGVSQCIRGAVSAFLAPVPMSFSRLMRSGSRQAH